MKDFKDIMAQIPFIDAHCHVMPRGVGKYASSGKPFAGHSQLAGLLLGYGSRMCFLTAGLPQEVVNLIWDGSMDPEECKTEVLKFLPLVEAALPVVFCRRGMAMLTGYEVDEINGDNWNHLDVLLAESGTGGDYAHLLSVMERDNITKLLLNMWTSWSAAYYGRYLDGLSDMDRADDSRAYSTLATFDSYAVAPFTEPTREYARIVGADAESFDGYDRFIEELADFFVLKREVKGFKISECYFRALDYVPVEKEKARAAFRENPSEEQVKTLSDYVTWRVLEQARRLQVPVQIHTGELWGETKVAQVSPMHLETAIRAFPDVKFDILHGGYPFMAELGILASNFRNIYLNLSAMPLRSMEQFEHWLGVYINTVSANRILVGTDVFNVECMAGCIDFIRAGCAAVASRMFQRGIASEGAIRRLFERILNKNACELYGIGDMSIMP